uniref:Uncharacterized protein MANES_02G088900 n=1 Tax=Rhizophora mucronata TaxID=61149 RepID=A0A2P2J0F9_RHIMU
MQPILCIISIKIVGLSPTGLVKT